MRVAITGASSFLGWHLAGALAEEPRVENLVLLDVRKPPEAPERSRFYELDLTSRSVEERLVEILSAERIDTVVHLATLSSPTFDADFEHELESVGTMHLVNACRRSRVRKVVHKSLSFLYGALPTNPNYLTEHHGVRARLDHSYFRDKFQCEQQIHAFGPLGSARVATVLRMAPVVGPTVDNYVARYLRRPLVPTVLGFDPLWQLLHEADAVFALWLSVLRDAPGIFNIVGRGVLPMSALIRLSGRTRVPLPAPVLRAGLGSLFATRVSDIPTFFVDYLQFSCLGDGSRASRDLGFISMFSTREALTEGIRDGVAPAPKVLAEGAI